MNYISVIIGIGFGIVIYLIKSGVDVLPGLVLLSIIGFFLYTEKLQGSGKSFMAVEAGADVQSVGFDDIGGQDIAKNELKEALDFIINEQGTRRLGIRPIKGILLSGPPGTGKTLLAKAAAKYTNSVFLSASGSEFVEMYVGVGAKRVRQIFNQAKGMALKQKKHSAVIFLDEIDVLGVKRGHSSSNVEYDQTLNELLVQMDGLGSDEGGIRVLVIAATNRADMLDEALLRPGRFDRQVRVDLPDKKGRLSILELHARNKPLEPDVNFDEMAQDTFGFSGAHLENMLNEAAILAYREDADEITNEHLKAAIDKVILGEKLDRIPSQDEKRRIAAHEAGHALVSEVLEPGSVAAIHVASRSNALGYVRPTQQEDMYLYTADYLFNRICVAVAGFAAEKTFIGSTSTGASNDFAQAARMAKQIIGGGMSKLGIVSAEDLPQQVLHDTISDILQQAENKVINLLSESHDLLEMITNQLLLNEYISGGDFRKLMNSRKAG